MLACWTRKEAYGKLLGAGIRYHLNQAELCVDLGAPLWSAAVTGLFKPSAADCPAAACGAQLRLPVAGAAALMCGGGWQPPVGSASATPRIRAFAPSHLPAD